MRIPRLAMQRMGFNFDFLPGSGRR